MKSMILLSAWLFALIHLPLKAVRNFSFQTISKDQKQILTGSPESGYNLLTWIAKNEVNSEKYQIERASAASGNTPISAWTVIQEILVPIFVGSDRLYTIKDYPETILSHYRLKMTSRDGNQIYSEIIQIKNDRIKSKPALYPNPTNQYLCISGNLQRESIQISVLNSNGQLIIQNLKIKESADGQFLLNISILPDGVYYLLVINPQTHSYEKLKFIKKQ